MSDMPLLSASAKELLGKVRMIVPPLLEKFHKGAPGALTSQNYSGFNWLIGQASWGELRSLVVAQSVYSHRLNFFQA